MSEGDFIESGYDEFDPEEVAKFQAQIEEEEQTDEDATEAYLRRRSIAYRRVFSPGERDQADIDIVLADMMWFCRARTNTFNPREGVHADRLSYMKEGRREVFYRIQDFSALSFEQVMMMYTNALTKQET